MNRYSLPLLLLAAGLLVTLGIVLTQQNAARRERELRFINSATTVRNTLIDALDQRTAKFETSINFITATHPTSADAYESFFSREGDQSDASDINPLDPGVIFVEEVLPNELEAFVARERAQTGRDFSVSTAGLPDDRPHLIATRAARPVEIGGVPILGLDIARIEDESPQIDFPDSGFTLSVMESDPVLSLFLDPSEIEAINGATIEPVVVAMIGAVPGDDERPLGWALWFFDLGVLIDSVDADAPEFEGLNLRLTTPPMQEPVAQITRPESVDLGDAVLSDRFELTTSSLTWNVDVWAADVASPGTGLFDQQLSWQLGISATALVMLAAFWWQTHREQLDIAEFELEHARALASTDDLTGLLNRKGMIELARELPNTQPATLFFFDLDAFKAVNDARGHRAGDEVLIRVADALRSIVRPGDYVGRLGGDEFVVFVPGVTGEAYERAISRRIIEAVSGIDEFVSCSVGVAARSGGEPLDVEEMLQEADRAMYEAKRAGGGRFTLSA